MYKGSRSGSCNPRSNKHSRQSTYRLLSNPVSTIYSNRSHISNIMAKKFKQSTQREAAKQQSPETATLNSSHSYSTKNGRVCQTALNSRDAARTTNVNMKLIAHRNHRNVQMALNNSRVSSCKDFSKRENNKVCEDLLDEMRKVP